MRKASQSLQPKVGRLCTATKPSYPCHLRERRCQPADREAGARRSPSWRSHPTPSRSPPGRRLPLSPGMCLPTPPHTGSSHGALGQEGPPHPADREPGWKGNVLSETLPLLVATRASTPAQSALGMGGGERSWRVQWVSSSLPGPVLTARPLDTPGPSGKIQVRQPPFREAHSSLSPVPM